MMVEPALAWIYALGVLATAVLVWKTMSACKRPRVWAASVTLAEFIFIYIMICLVWPILLVAGAIAAAFRY